MSAFSLFFMQSPSFLAHQRRLEEGQGRSNCQTLFGLDRIPRDNHVRTLLDPVSPDHFHPVFAEVVTELERSDGLKDSGDPAALHGCGAAGSCRRPACRCGSPDALPNCRPATGQWRDARSAGARYGGPGKGRSAAAARRACGAGRCH